MPHAANPVPLVAQYAENLKSDLAVQFVNELTKVQIAKLFFV